MPKMMHFNPGGTVDTIDLRSLPVAIAEAIERLETEYAEQIALGTTYAGKPLQIDRDSTANMTAMAAQVTAGIQLPDGFSWRMADNTFLPVTGAQVIALGATAAARVYALLRVLWAAKDAARAATTREEADAVTATWPPA